ncbi:hypothetical protein EPUL_001830, partial [Erysiphe pulchra]
MNGISTSPANSNSSRSSYNDLTSSDLPIRARITPGFAVLIYLSSAYLAGVATTVLILYVMNLPISNATQAAYVVAVIATGAILGAASILFSEITEGLCCLLGGFSLSMWLLVLRPNGLLSGNSMIALITIISIGSFATSFSKAGLKEFWAYLWALNPNLFPFDDTSYPLTRGMRVEIASILVISVAGIISQMKLWKIVQERRKKKLDEGLIVSRKIEEEEDNIGKKIVEQTAKEKDQWEEVFRDEDKNHSLPTESITTRSMIQQTESIKMAAVPSQSIDSDKEFLSIHKGLEATNRGTIIVRVAQDIDENRDHVNEKIKYTDPETEVMGQPDDQARLEKQTLDSSSISLKKVPTSAVSPVPVIVALPFKIPETFNSFDNDRSSIGTQATIGDEILDDKIQLPEQQLITSNSQPKNFRDSTTASRSIDLSVNCDLELEAKPSVDSNSEEDILPSPDSSMPRKLSIASAEATKNSLSPSSLKSENPFSKEAPELEIKEQNDLVDSENRSKLKVNVEKPLSPRSSISKTIEGQERVEDPSSPSSSPPSIIDEKVKINSQLPKNSPQNHQKSSRSRSSSTNSQIKKKITKDTLPSHVSKIFMSYRTNEWAKHLEYAEKPEIEDLEKCDVSSHSECENVEKPVPVRIQELQQTPENPCPPPSHSSSNQFYRQSGIMTSESNINSDQNYQSRDKIITNNSQGSLVSQHSLVPSNRVNHLSMAPSAHNNLRFEHPTDSRSTLMESSKGNNILPQAQLNSVRVRNSALINHRSSIARNKGLYKRLSGVSMLDPNSAAISQAGSSETGSTYNCPLLLEDDEMMSLSQRRDLIRQASVAAAANSNQASHSMTYNTAQLRRMSSLPSSQTRQQQLAWWRASVRQDLQASLPPQDRIEQQRNMLRESQKLDEMKRLAEERKKDAREVAWNDMMRSQEMLDAH